MRNLFLGLVLANLAFAAWSAWLAPAERAVRVPDEGSMMPSSTRIITSIVTPGGMNSGNRNDAMNNTDMSGTPRTSST